MAAVSHQQLAFACKKLSAASPAASWRVVRGYRRGSGCCNFVTYCTAAHLLQAVPETYCCTDLQHALCASCLILAGSGVFSRFIPSNEPPFVPHFN